MRLTADRLHVDVSADPRLADRVADNLFRPQKFDGTESETLQIGTGFGITPDIEQGPDGNLYVVSNTDNVIYKISKAMTSPFTGTQSPPTPNPIPFITFTAVANTTFGNEIANTVDNNDDVLPLLGVSILP